LDVPEFQFLPGGPLFGAYVAILLPFIALVVVLCEFRKYRNVWRKKPEQPPVSPLEMQPLSLGEVRRSASTLQRQFSQL
jgi:hypothetical protein